MKKPMICQAKLNLDAIQREAVENILFNQGGISVLCGSAGRGKTTIVNEILSRLLADKKVKPELIRICGPTGKCCHVVNNMIKVELPYKAMTIHRLLGCQGPLAWEYHKGNRLEVEWLFVEEASMIGVSLLARLINSVSRDCHIILSGDDNQLFPVSAGAPFRDIIAAASKKTNVSTLKINYRQHNGELLADVCEKVLRGELPSWGNPKESTFSPHHKDNAFFHETDDKHDIQEKVLDLIRPWHKQKQDYMVLIPQRTGVAGISAMNTFLQQQLNPPSNKKSSIKVFNFSLRLGDRVRQIKNNYGLKVYNGFVGTIIKLDQRAKKITVDFDGQIVEYEEKKDIQQLVLAYACTIHAAQGSQYRRVCVVFHSSHYYMLSRALLYVAISRAQEELHLVGDKRAVKRGLKNDVRKNRDTYLKLVL